MQDMELVREFVRSGSQEAFTALIGRHVEAHRVGDGDYRLSLPREQP